MVSVILSTDKIISVLSVVLLKNKDRTTASVSLSWSIKFTSKTTLTKLMKRW